MDLRALIDTIEPFVPDGYSRSGTNSIAAMIQQAIDQVFSEPGAYRTYIADDNQGFPPYLLTTAGVYRYSLTAANLSCGAPTMTYHGTEYEVLPSRVLRVFVDANNFDYGKRWVGQSLLYTWENPYSSTVPRMSICPLPFRQQESIDTDAATVEFFEDPGTTTDRIFIEFLWQHMRLDSESVPVMMQERDIPRIQDYVIGRIQTLANGTPSPLLQRWEKEHLPTMRLQSSVNARDSLPRGTRTRYC